MRRQLPLVNPIIECRECRVVTQLDVGIAGSCLEDCALKVGCMLHNAEVHGRAHLSICCHAIQLGLMENMQLLGFRQTNLYCGRLKLTVLCLSNAASEERCHLYWWKKVGLQRWNQSWTYDWCSSCYERSFPISWHNWGKSSDKDTVHFWYFALNLFYFRHAKSFIF